MISSKGISIAPSKLQALNAVPVPLNGAQLMQYVCTLNFLRNKIPMFNKVMAPLREMLQKVLKCTKRNTKAGAKKVLLKNVGWRGPPDGFHDKAFQTYFHICVFQCTYNSAVYSSIYSIICAGLA